MTAARAARPRRAAPAPEPRPARTGAGAEAAAGAAARLLVADAMHAGVVTCSPQASVTVAARIMAAHRIHAVVVAVPAPGRLRALALLTDLDVVAALADGRDEQPALGAASLPPLCVTPGDDLDDAVRIMRDHRTTHVVVVEPAARRPVGMLSTLDVAEAVAQAR